MSTRSRMNSAKSRLVRGSGHLQEALTRQWFAGHKQITGALPLILIVAAFWLSWLPWQGRTGLTHPLLARFVQTELRTSLIIGSRVDREHLLHLADKLGTALGRNTPLLVEP